MKTLILNILMMLLLTSCLPDSLEKWEMDEPQELTGCSNISIQGQTICAEAASSELFAAGFSYPSIESNEDKLTLPTVVELSSINPEFVGEPEGATYFFTSAKSSSPETWFDFSEYGLALDQNTGAITGTPTKFLPRTDVMIKAYHVQSGQWFSYEFNMAIATNFEVEGRALSYPFPDVVSYERLRLAVSDASIFSTCSEQTCFTTSSEVKGYIEHIDPDRNLLFVKIKTSDRAGEDWEKEVITVGENIENGNDFIASSSTIDEVVRTVDLSNSTHQEYKPYFNFGLDTESEEWKDLRWSISPLPPGGIRDGKQSDQGFQLVYKDDATPSNMGILYWGGQDDPEKPQEYTISVKNSIGQILQTKIMLNFERPPEGLGVSNFALLEVDQYDKIYVGDYISTTEEDLAKVYHKTYASYEDTEGETQYKYYLMVKLLKGDFTDKEEIDHFKTFSRSVATIKGETQLVNNVLTIQHTDGSDAFGNLNSAGEYDNKYISHNDGDTATLKDIATLKMTATSLQTIEVVNPDQFSVGLQVVDENNNSAVVMGIYTNIADVDDIETKYVIVQPTKNTLESEKKLQIGRSTFDQTEESADYILTTSTQEFKNIFLLSSSSNPARIQDLFNPTQTSHSNVAQSKVYSSGSSRSIISLWSPMIKLWSDVVLADPVIDDNYVFAPGSDVYTFSRLTGVVNKRDKEEKSIYIEMDQFGFLPHKQDSSPDTSGNSIERPFHFAFSERHEDKQQVGDKTKYTLFNDKDADGNESKDPGITTIQLGMSPTFVVYRGENINIKSQTHHGGNMDYFLEPSPETLPAGITYDSTTGTFSGIPEVTMEPRKYTITARNPLGSTSYEFYLQVKDRLLIKNQSVSISDYMLHKSGQSRQHQDCQITQEQINNFQINERDILCTLDAPEEDLQTHGVDLAVDVGPNICEYLNYRPYSFNNVDAKYKYQKTGTSGILPSWVLYGSDGELKVNDGSGGEGDDASIGDLPTLKPNPDGPGWVKIFRQYTKPEGCTQCYHPELKRDVPCGELISDELQCDGDHSSIGGPNCDDGNYVVRSITIGEDIDPDSIETDEEGNEITTEVEDGDCGFSKILTPTYSLNYPEGLSSWDIEDQESWTSLGDTHDLGDLENQLSINQANLPNVVNPTNLPLRVHGKLYLDLNNDGVISAADDLSGDNKAEAFTFYYEDGGANDIRLIHINRFLSTDNECADFDEREEVTFDATLADFWGTLNLGLEEDVTIDNVALASTGGNKELTVTLTLSTPATLEFTLIQQPSIMKRKGANLEDVDLNVFYFLVDKNCDGINDSAISYNGVTDEELIGIVTFGMPYGLTDEINDHKTNFDNSRLKNLLFNVDGNLSPDSIDIDGSGTFERADDADNSGETDSYILTIQKGKNKNWSTMSEDADEAVTSCGGSYGSCLMGQADPSRVDSGDSDIPSNAFSGANFDISLQNTEPEGEASWDVANYTAENSCAISPNMFFEAASNLSTGIFPEPDPGWTTGEEIFDDGDPTTTDVTKDTLEINRAVLNTMKGYGSGAEALEEVMSNGETLYNQFNHNIEGQYGLGLGDLVARDKSDGHDDEIPRPSFAHILRDDDNGTDLKAGILNFPHIHALSYETKRNSDNKTGVHFIRYFRDGYENKTDNDEPLSDHSAGRTLVEVEKLNLYDQEVRNWAKMSDKVYLKVHVEDLTGNGSITDNYTDLDNVKAAIGLEVKSLTGDNVARLEDYIEGGEDFVIISVDKDKQEEIIRNLVDGSLQFFVNDKGHDGVSNIVDDTNIDKVFQTKNIKYLPEILTTKYSSAHDYRPNMFYYVECLDEAFDIKARIALQIREWDRRFTNGSDLDKTIPSTRMDDRSIDLFEENYNEYADHDDFKTKLTSETRDFTIGASDVYEGCFLKTPTLYNTEKDANLIHELFD